MFGKYHAGAMRARRRTIGMFLFLVFLAFGTLLLYIRLHSVWIDRDLAAGYQFIRDTAPGGSVVVVPEAERVAAHYYSRREAISVSGNAGKRAEEQAAALAFLTGTGKSKPSLPLYFVVTPRDVERLADWGSPGMDATVFGNTTVTMALASAEMQLDLYSGNATLHQLRNQSGDTVGYALERNGANQTIGTYLQDGEVVKKDGKGCLIMSDAFVYLDDPACDLPIVRMIAGVPVKGAELVYDKGNVKVYRVG